MSDEIIFEITKDHLENGLRNIPMGYCASSYIDPKRGLFYSGHPLKDLVNWEPTSVIYLLLYGYPPSEKELKQFETKLQCRASISENVLNSIKNLPKSMDPLDMCSVGMLLLGTFEKENDFEKDCLNIIAKLPLLCAYIINYHAGVENNLQKYDSPYLKNFIYNLNLGSLNKEFFYEVLKVHNILYYDHGGGSFETFVAKVIGTGNLDIYSCISGAMNALKSEYNAKASIHAYKFIQKLADKFGDVFSERLIEEEIISYLKENKKLFGFGHTVFQIEDPRATVMFEYAKKRFAEHRYITLAFYLRVIAKKVLAENTKIKNPNMNIDGISGALLSAAGFDYPDYFPLLIAMARSVGIAIQIYHESVGKSKKMMHPNYIYRAIF